MSSCLEIRNVSKVWPEIRALSNVNLKIGKKEIHAVIGPNGAGKSTLFGIVSGGVDQTEGDVIFFGENLKKSPDWKRVRKGMATAFQVPRLFSDITVMENIIISCRIHNNWKFNTGFKGLFMISKEIEEKALSSLNEVGIHSLKNQKVSEISHGDKKRLEIAIAIALEPKLLLLDEPTAGMSPEDTNKTVKLIQDIYEKFNLSVLLTEHNMDVIFTLADKISVLNRGELLVTDTPENIRNNKMVKEVYLGQEVM